MKNLLLVLTLSLATSAFGQVKELTTIKNTISTIEAASSTLGKVESVAAATANIEQAMGMSISAFKAQTPKQQARIAAGLDAAQVANLNYYRTTLTTQTAQAKGAE